MPSCVPGSGCVMGGEASNMDAAWQKIDDAHAKLQLVQLDHEQTKGQVNLLAQDLHNIKLTMAEHRAESKQGMDRMQTSLDTINVGIGAIQLERAKQDGAGMSRREMFAWACSGVGLIAGLLALAKVIA